MQYTLNNDPSGGRHNTRILPLAGARPSANLSQALPTLIAGTDAALITLDRQGIVRSWNPAATHLLGYSSSAALGCPLDTLVSPPGQSQLSRMLGDLAQVEPICTVEVTLRRADDTLAAVALTFSHVRDRAGQVLGVALVGRARPARRHIVGSIA